MADLHNIEEDIELPVQTATSPVARRFKRLKRKGDPVSTANGASRAVEGLEDSPQSDQTPYQDDVVGSAFEATGTNTADVEGVAKSCEHQRTSGGEHLNEDGNEKELGASDGEDFAKEASDGEDREDGDFDRESNGEAGMTDGRHVVGESDDEEGGLGEESDEDEQYARKLAEERAGESEGEGGGSASDSDGDAATAREARKERSEGTRDGEGSEAEAEELDFDRDRDEDEYEGPSQPDVLLKKHKRRRSGEEDIHAESQRLLRESRGVGFKPQATVQKPLSSLLEKLRKRKEELFRASEPPQERPKPQVRPKAVRKPLSEDVLNQAMKRQRRVGESSDDDSEGDDDVSDDDDDALLEILTAEKSPKAAASPTRRRLPNAASPTANRRPQNGYEGDREDDDDDEMTSDLPDPLTSADAAEPFRPPVADTQDLFTEPQDDNVGVDGSVQEDNDMEAKPPSVAAERPVFSIFQKKQVAKVPKFSEPFRMPVEDTQDLFSEPQFDDEKVETAPEERQETATEARLEEGADVARDVDNDVAGDVDDDMEDDVIPSKIKLTMDNSKSQPDTEPWAMDDSDDDCPIDDKENTPPIVAPSPKKKAGVSDAVRKFVDDEADEEDSDGNLGNLSDDDEDPAAAADEMEYLIDTRAEAVIDRGEKERLSLHRQWLEQQDMKDTKDLLDRMKNGWQRPKPAGALLGSDEEDDDDLAPDILRRRRLQARAAARAREDAFDDYDADVAASGGEEGSDGDGPGSEDEEFREQVLRRRRLQESESLEPEPMDFDDDEASREVLGMMKRVGVPTAGPVEPIPGKEKARGSLLGLFSKKNKALKSSSSFLNRAASASRDASNNVTTANAGSGNGRYYIFGRDDSNSGLGLDRRENNESEGEKAADPGQPTLPRAPTNFAGIASRVGAAGAKKAAPLGAMAPSKFFGLLSRSARPEIETEDTPPEVPSFLREFKAVKKSAFVR